MRVAIQRLLTTSLSFDDFYRHIQYPELLARSDWIC